MPAPKTLSPAPQQKNAAPCIPVMHHALWVMFHHSYSAKLVLDIYAFVLAIHLVQTSIQPA